MNKLNMYAYEDGDLIEETGEFDIDDKKEVEYILSVYFEFDKGDIERVDKGDEIMFLVSDTEYIINKKMD